MVTGSEIKEWELRIEVLEAVKTTMQSKLSGFYSITVVDDNLTNNTFERVKAAVTQDIEEIDRKILILQEMNKG